MLHLMQLYIYDFSAYLQLDVDDNGLFAPYANLTDYWKGNNNKYAYLVTIADKNAGFVLVRQIHSTERSYFSIAEFFILKKYRLRGIGRAIAKEVFEMHRGQWEVFQRTSNQPAQRFWHNVIKAYTKGQFKERFEEDRRIQVFAN